ncbi:hypothetical protein [Nodularia spumigena]|jgi:hypothetical protein|uniref:Uncharacterized protein n=2 Tax=Cyanophyceae TaxID=3028117 RepID=A0A166KBS7_NODSP|nr:hypothetical protein [Nodularia spumigena]MDB9358144.1 hypothetical protein [Nodularia spumigena CS-587/03]KZL50877.1 hypothetical protein A2T98_05280 [Nodularia spumigena CENA596]MDB9304901.1 hypothetical protein [Nodularia spumigena CS-591/12]MDB9318288.1 hypothetical protein [Nodularia spumigena CS-590/01A]MDB9323035.1 hypothetical protein [Nodularia spumigena CS-591/07A]
MEALFCLSPRYRLDDESPWLQGIDPSRHYWIAVNGDSNVIIAIPGLVVSSMSELKQAIRQFRSLQPGEQMTVNRIASDCTIHCVSPNCYAVEAEINHAPIWHLFDQETLDSLLMTAHPEWQCAPSDIDLGRKLLMRSLLQTATTKK